MIEDGSLPGIRVLRPSAGVAEIRLDHPERLNAVDEITFGALGRALDAIEADGAVRVVLLAGEGRAFCAGANYKRHASGDRTPDEMQAYIDVLLDGCERLRTFARPIVAVVQGYAVGIGLEMALNCDFVIAAETAQFGFPEIERATFVGGGVTRTLPRLVGLARAREMIMFGERLTGPDALAAGLVSRCVPDAELRTRALAFAERLARQAPAPIGFAKRLLNSDGDMPVARAAERAAVVACMATEDWKEGVRSFAEKRPPVYEGR